MSWQGALLVALGGAIGSLARWAAVFLVGARVAAGFPWGTLAVNVLGSLLIGAFAAWARTGSLGVTPDARLFLVVGLCGGFTTFSSFSFETFALLQRGAYGAAGGYVAASLALCLGATAVGFAAARLVPAPL